MNMNNNTNNDFPELIPIFPLKGVVMFPDTYLPLNIFEPRYLEMINKAISSKSRLIGMIQPKILGNKESNDAPQLHNIGCMGKITSFKETEDSRYLIELKGMIRFKIVKETKTNKKYRECEIDFKNYYEDLETKKEEIKFSDLELIFKDLKTLFEKRGFIINWKALEKQSLDETINALAMASPFSLEEKQILLEADNIDIRKYKIAEILRTYTHDLYENTTLQ